MWQLVKRFRSFLSCLLSRSIHDKTRNHRYHTMVPLWFFSSTKCFQNTYKAPISASGRSHEVEINQVQGTSNPDRTYAHSNSPLLSHLVKARSHCVKSGRPNKPNSNNNNYKKGPTHRTNVRKSPQLGNKNTLIRITNSTWQFGDQPTSATSRKGVTSKGVAWSLPL